MRILSSDIAMHAEHASMSVMKQQTSVRQVQVQAQPNETSANKHTHQHEPHYHVTPHSKQTHSVSSQQEEDQNLPPEVAKMKKAIESLMAWISGKTIKMDIFSADDLKPTTTMPPVTAAATSQPDVSALSSPAGMVFQHQQAYFEAEQVSLGMEGSVRTADGKAINFNLSMSMARSYYSEQNIEIRTGAALQDPLIVNYDGKPAQLSLNKVALDLNQDGQPEALPELAPGSGYLVMDRNGNGTIDDGSELFGPSSGHGFQELAQLDQDANGWIDEADMAFSQLALWQPSNQGSGALVGLGKLGIGALSVNSIAAPFDYKDDNNLLQGKMQRAGLFLFEDGRAGSMQQIDIAA